MKINRVLLVTALLFSQITLTGLDAKGNVKGGDKGRKSNGKPTESIQRSPSMSRANRPSKESRQSSSRENSKFQGSRPSTPERESNKGNGSAATRDHVKKFIKDHPSTLPSQGPGNKLPNRPAKDYDRRPDNKFPNRPGKDHDKHGHNGDKHKVWNKYNGKKYYNVGKNVRHNYHNRYKNKGQWFNKNFWDRHHYHPPYYTSYNNWWGVATVGALGAWLGWQSQPYYYGNYDNLSYSGTYWGPLESNITYSPPTYYQQSQSIEAAGNQTQNNEWMPLGVFAVSKTSDSVASPNMFVQLAVNKEGIISGTFYNATTDQTYELEGFVDQDSQRAAWQIVDSDDSPVVETGIYNLTEAESTGKTVLSKWKKFKIAYSSA